MWAARQIAHGGFAGAVCRGGLQGANLSPAAASSLVAEIWKRVKAVLEARLGDYAGKKIDVFVRTAGEMAR